MEQKEFWIFHFFTLFLVLIYQKKGLMYPVRRKSKNSYPSWIDSSKTSSRKRSMETQRKRTDAGDWLCTYTDWLQRQPLLTVVVAHSKKSKKYPRNYWQRVSSLGSRTRERTPRLWQGSSRGFERQSSATRWATIVSRRRVLLTGGRYRDNRQSTIKSHTSQ